MAAGFVQVLGASAGTTGCGFLLGSGNISTCAHVCATALGKPELKLSATPPSAPISLIFPFVSSAVLTASVTSWSPDSAGGADAAILTLFDALPARAHSFPIISARGSSGAPFEVHGFQTGTSFGVDARGHIGGQNARGWFELIGDSVHGFFIQPGFSGGPVWDVARQACIGMIKAVATDSALRVAFLVPNEMLSLHLTGYADGCKLSPLPPFDKNRHCLFLEASKRHHSDRNLIAGALADLIPETEDPTERHWIYEALGDIGGDVARATILRALSDEFDPFARTGVENAARSF
jgi:hypothetical protein